jgi:hypothetical protein
VNWSQGIYPPITSGCGSAGGHCVSAASLHRPRRGLEVGGGTGEEDQRGIIHFLCFSDKPWTLVPYNMRINYFDVFSCRFSFVCSLWLLGLQTGRLAQTNPFKQIGYAK